MASSGQSRKVVAALSGCVLIAGIALAALWQRSVRNRHSAIQSVQELPLGSAIRLAGVVTYTDVPGNRFWIQDETGAIPVEIGPKAAGISVGETVLVEGVKTQRFDSRQGPASVRLQRLRVWPASFAVRLPEPAPASLDNFPHPDRNGMRVRMSGVVRRATTDAFGQARLRIANTGIEIELVVASPGRDYAALVGSRLRIVGVPEQRRSLRGAVLSNRLWVASGRDTELEQSPPLLVPLYTVRSLYADHDALNGNRIRVRGRVAAVAPESMLLEDQWGAISCELLAPQKLLPGETVEVSGFPSRNGLQADLFEAQARPLRQLHPEPGPLPLFAIRQIRELTSDQAGLALPVEVTGTVTYDDPQWKQLYVQDDTAGIYVRYAGDHPEVKPGVRLTLVGITHPGGFAPIIMAPRMMVRGSGQLPRPEAVTLERAAAGLLDSQYVTLTGIVHPVASGEETNHSIITFELMTEIGQIHVYTSPSFSGVGQMRQLEDARVRIRGVFATLFNSRRQLVGYQLLVASPSDIDVLEPAAADPFSLPATPIGSLLSFSRSSRFGHRIRVEGVVTLTGPGFLYLQDTSGGLRAEGDTSGIRVGDRLAAAGYPAAVGLYSPVLTDAGFRRLGLGIVAPLATTAEELLQGQNDSSLVTAEGKLLMTLGGAGRRSLVFQSGIRTFTAQLDTSDLRSPFSAFPDGSVLRVTGVCANQVDPSHLYRALGDDEAGVQILLRSAADLSVVHRAPFWTLSTTLALLGLALLLVVAILVWVGVLRRRVRAQMHELRRAAETSQAIRDLSAAMQNVSAEQRFDVQVSVRGSSDIAQLVVGFNAMLAELQQRDRAKCEAEARLQQLALIDELTGLPNRRLLSDRLSQSLALARRRGNMLALLYIDLDGFKVVNDSLGHRTGDLLLTQVAQRLQARSRRSDTLARLGGDEFTLILSGIRCCADAEKAARGLLEALRQPFEIEGHAIRIGGSIGISLFPDHSREPDQLLQQADCAMYAAKRNGRNRIVLFGEELGKAARERFVLESELRHGLAGGNFSVHFQPEFDLRTGRIVRFEALARWTHPEMGPIPPLSFIPVAEESGLIFPLGAWIMEEACRTAVEWQRLADRPIQVGVNVSSVQFARDEFVDEVADILERTGLPASLLQIELTESAMLAGVDRAAATMNRLGSMGIGIAIDDFGTGYSSLSHLSRLAFDALKIHRSFVGELRVRPETEAFVQSILTLAHNLHMRVIAEGIETADQLTLMKRLGADEAQGFLLGMPSADPGSQLRLERQSSGLSPLETLTS